MFSRRQLLTGSAALALSATVSPSAEARAPLANKQVPGIFRQMVGDFEVTALLDGDIALPPELFPVVKPEELQALAARAYQPFPVHSPVNAYAVNTGDKLYLVDTGTGSFGKNFPGAEVGHLGDSLAAAGIKREDVDAILLTHLHPDHFGGLLKDDQVLFPKAEIIVPEVDYAFWMDPKKEDDVPADFKFLFQLARKTMTPYEKQIRKIRRGPIATGITATSIPGHTPGHMGYIIGVGPESRQMLIWGDLIHNAAIQFARPDITMIADIEPALAAESRRVGLEWVAAETMLVGGMHLPFPGIGRVEMDRGGAYRYIPVEWKPKY